MKCEYMLCIYHSDNACILDDIEVNSVGMCESCITVNIPEEYVMKERETALARFKAIHDEWDK